jgi:hypothetical protein
MFWMTTFGQLRATMVAATLVGALSCSTRSDVAHGQRDPGATDGTPSSVATDQGVYRSWFALYSHQHESAQFVSINENRQTLYVEATSPNLELASIVKVTRGRLTADTLRQLSEALHALGRMDPAAITAMRPIEPIEQNSPLADVGTCGEGTLSSWSGLATSSMLPEVSEALTQAAREASNLPLHRPPSLVQGTRMEAARARRIRTDPRNIYDFVPVQQNALSSSPHLLAALRCPGLVVETNESEDLLVRQWLRSSNPKRMGDTLFLEVEGDTVRGVFQIHVRELRALP